MKRRSKVRATEVKARRPKSARVKRQGLAKDPSGLNSPAAGEKSEISRLARELKEARAQQRATSDILQVITSFAGELEPVFQAILANAARLCEAHFGTLTLNERDTFRVVALHNVPEAFAELRRRHPTVRFSPKHPLARQIATKQVLHIADVKTEAAYLEGDPSFVRFVDLAAPRTLLNVPMLKANEVIGTVGIYRKEVRRFTQEQIELLENFAAQAVIAIENARLLNELREALEQQTAASEVLQVISSSSGDLQPVFDRLLRNATQLCRAKFGTLYLLEEAGLRLMAAHNMPEAFAKAHSSSAADFTSVGGALGGAMSTKRPVQITDLAATEAYKQRHPKLVEAVELGGIRTALAVPMLKDDVPIGVIALIRPEVAPFNDKQIALLASFAAQAVIAIENARLLNELRQRTTDLANSLVQQTAMSDVLRVITNSPTELGPVFDAILANAVRICEARFGNLALFDGSVMRIAAFYNAPPEFEEMRRRDPIVPLEVSFLGRLVRTTELVHIRDLSAEEPYAKSPLARVAGARSALAVPMLKEKELVGAIAIYDQEVRPFTEKQIDVLRNFAVQAVIAIENARLLNELRQRTTDLTERTADLTEALERQTATTDVLQVISSSTGDLQPVFATMLENAARLCDANFGNIFRWDGEALHLIAIHNTPPAFAEYRQRRPLPLKQNLPFARMVAEKAVVHCADAAALTAYTEQHDPEVSAAVELGGIRTFLAVPMLKEDQLIGTLIVYRQEVRPFSDKQIELLANFAAQAVIAIENARLLNELRQRTAELTGRTADLTEALEQRTATSEVLEVISSSPGDLQPVFETMLDKAVHICDAGFGNIFRWDGEAIHLVATHGTPPAFAEARRRISPNPINPKTSLGRMIVTKAVVHVADAAAEPGYLEEREPAAVAAVELGGVRTALFVPMLKEGELIGAFTLSRQEVCPFTDKQIELVQNFAAQAVIAIENARLLKELRERTDQLETQSQQLEKLNRQLEQRVTDQVGEIERMSRLRRFLPPQVADLIVASGSEKQLESHRREITALFCDLRGFTGFTESADAEDVMALLRDYHAAIGEIIIKYNGTLERYAGDGVMVVFNDPVPVENPALQAVLMALEVRDAIGALTETWRRLGHDIGFGIGIAHGFATLGTIGFEGRFDYAAIGTVSNVASRLCDEAKPGQILISPRVLMKVEKAVQVEPVGEFELKGIRRPLAAYNVVGTVS